MALTFHFLAIEEFAMGNGLFCWMIYDDLP
jgi:hypothetical protein